MAATVCLGSEADDLVHLALTAALPTCSSSRSTPLATPAATAHIRHAPGVLRAAACRPLHQQPANSCTARHGLPAPLCTARCCNYPAPWTSSPPAPGQPAVHARSVHSPKAVPSLPCPQHRYESFVGVNNGSFVTGTKAHGNTTCEKLYVSGANRYWQRGPHATRPARSLPSAVVAPASCLLTVRSLILVRYGLLAAAIGKPDLDFNWDPLLTPPEVSCACACLARVLPACLQGGIVRSSP